jgi:hypothetical protein
MQLRGQRLKWTTVDSFGKERFHKSCADPDDGW